MVSESVKKAWQANGKVNAVLLEHLTPEMLSARMPGGGYTLERAPSSPFLIESLECGTLEPSMTLPNTNDKRYQSWLADLKERVKRAQLKAALAVNAELTKLYWQIGKSILEKQAELGWGTKVVDQLAKDLKKAFPEMKGLSRTNLLYMRAFADAYPDEAIVQQAVGQIPWGHNLRLLDKLNDQGERLWYVQKTIQNGWSRNILEMQIETGLYHRQGKAISNFAQTLPALQSDLARQTLKDPYNFEFLGDCRRRLRKGGRAGVARAHPGLSVGTR